MLFSTPIAKILFPVVTDSYSENGLLMGVPTSSRIASLIVHYAAAELWSMSCGPFQSCHNHFKSLIGFLNQSHASTQAIFFTWNSWEFPGQSQVSPPLGSLPPTVRKRKSFTPQCSPCTFIVVCPCVMGHRWECKDDECPPLALKKLTLDRNRNR